MHPFLWNHGQMLDLTESRGAKFGGTYGTVSAMNNQGQVTGTMNLTGDLTWHSFLWSRGRMTDLGTLGGAVTSALWMNEAGHIVGRSDVTQICEACGPNNQKQLPHPFLWKDGRMVDLGLLYADTGGTAVSVNAETRSWVKRPHARTSLGTTRAMAYITLFYGKTAPSSICKPWFFRVPTSL